MMTRLKIIVMLCLCTVSAVEFSITEEGLSDGYSFNCPKSLPPSIMNPGSLERLTISVLGPGKSASRSKLTPYDYYNIKHLPKNPDIDFKKKTFMFVGGYLEGVNRPLVKNIAYLYRNMGYNALILNTLEFTRGNYPLASSFVRPVGKHVAEMLANLTTLGLDPKRLELVSHSIGGHTMGFIGKNYRQLTGRNISSLTALDPAGPCFRNLGPGDRLDSSDADFVLSVATNIDGFGIATPLGHVSFYVNGGEFQAADVWFLPCTFACSHAKVFYYWKAALLNPNKFIGVQCDTIQQAREGDCYDRKPKVSNTMDLLVDRSKPGIYFLVTFNRYPYGLGKKGLKKEHDPTLQQLSLIQTDDLAL